MVTEIISKRCVICNQIKMSSEFHKRRASKDGLQKYCKACGKAFRSYAYEHSERGRAVNRKAGAKYHKTPKGKASMRRATAKFNDRNPNYVKAHNAVNEKIRAGKLPRPDTLLCHYCPKQAEQYHHWHGYEKECWLDVVPACVECHTKEHRKIA